MKLAALLLWPGPEGTAQVSLNLSHLSRSRRHGYASPCLFCSAVCPMWAPLQQADPADRRAIIG